MSTDFKMGSFKDENGNEFTISIHEGSSRLSLCLDVSNPDPETLEKVEILDCDDKTEVSIYSNRGVTKEFLMEMRKNIDEMINWIGYGEVAVEECISRNGTMYPKGSFEKSVKEFQDKITKNSVYGTLNLQ